MNLATPAPKVDQATCDSAPLTEAAIAKAAKPTAAPKVDPVTEPNKPLKVLYTAPVKETIMSVASLSGTSGAEFEHFAAVLRGAPEKTILQAWLPFIFDERDFVTYGEVLRYVLVKGNCCFVFPDKESLAPLYAIPLEEVSAVLEDPKNRDPHSVTISPTPGKMCKNEAKDGFVTVLLKYCKDNSQAYQFTFDTSDDPSIAKNFCRVINKKTQMKATVTASVLKANHLGSEAAKSQPFI